MHNRQIFIGSMIHANENREVIFKNNVGIFIQDGKILEVLENPDENKIDDFGADKVIKLSEGQFIIPGFIDCHTCAMHFPNRGLGYDKTFLDWLENYIFPLERRYSDIANAMLAFDSVVHQTIQCGTTTACYFASLCRVASVMLAMICSRVGQRAFIGKINMNAPRDDGYYESTEESLANTRVFVEFVKRLDNPLVKPIITPRFALYCDIELMQGLASFAREEDLHVQTTISQSRDEVQAVRRKFENATYADIFDAFLLDMPVISENRELQIVRRKLENASYPEVYYAAGLFTHKTSLVHGVHLDDEDIALLMCFKISIIHCPTSNLNLKSGFCDVRLLMARNINVGIGTDISGGSNCSMLSEMRAALNTSIVLSLTKDDYVPLDYKDVFYMATLGGARALSIENTVGNFMPGKEFDALIVDLKMGRNILNARQYTLEEKLQILIYTGTSHNVESVYVKGKKIK